MHKRAKKTVERYWRALRAWAHARSAFVIASGLIAVFALQTFVAPAMASGSASWTANGVVAAAATNGFLAGDQESAVFEQSTSGPVVRTSDGYNVYVFTNDAVGSGIYAQKVNDAGVVQWGSGVTVYDGAGGLGNSRPRVVADTAGGVIVVYGTSSGLNDIYAQRLDSTGATQWAAGGLAVADVGASAESSAVVLPDGSDGVLVAYVIGSDVRAQRLNGSGAKQWTATGVVVSAAANNQRDPLVVTDGSGGMIVAWEDLRNGGTNEDLYAQRLNASGVVQWTANGVAITSATQNQDRMTSADADGSGGIVVAWEDSRTGSEGVYAQRLDSSGAQVWTANGVQVSSATTNPNPKVAMSGTDVMVFYYASPYLTVQKLNSSGVAQFSGSGLALTSTSTNEDYPAMAVTAGDGSGDVLIAVTRQYQGSSVRDVIAQRVNSNGTVDWASGGVLAIDPDLSSSTFPITTPYAITTTSGDFVLAGQTRVQQNFLFYDDAVGQLLNNATGAPQFNGTRGLVLPNGPGSDTAEQLSPRVAADGSGNYFLAWDDNRHNGTRVFLQKVNASGVSQWTASGVALATGINQQLLGLLSDGAGGVYVVWADTTYSDVLKIKRLDSSGATAGGWSSSGLTISPAGGSSVVWGIVTDGANGAIVMYESSNRMYGVRVTSAAGVPWGATGVEVSDPLPSGTVGHEYGAIASDGAGGAYFAWQHINTDINDPDLRVVRLASADGSVSTGWTSYGDVVTTEDTAIETSLSAVSGGVVVAWDEDPGSLGNANVKAQMLNTTGDTQWTAGGVDVVTATDTQTVPKVIASDTGSIVVWKDLRSGVSDDMYAQRLNASGVAQWTANGVVVSDASGNQGGQFDVVSDGGAGVIVVWKDTRSEVDGDVYAQRLDSTGTAMWTANGIVVANRAGFAEDKPTAASNGNAGLVTAFQSLSGATQTRVQMIADSDGAPTVTVTAPNGSESLTGGATSSITWTNSGVVDHYRITLSTDGGSTYSTVVTASDAASPYSWTVDNTTTATARIKIEAQDANNVTLASDASNADFSITASGGGGGGGGGGGNPPPAITLGQPNGGDHLSAGSSTNVLFTTQGTQVQVVRLSYSLDDGATYIVITSNANPASGVYVWTVPDISSSTVRLRAEALGSGDTVLATDASDAVFAITGGTTTPTDSGTSTVPVTPPIAPPTGSALLSAETRIGVNVSSLEFAPLPPVPQSGDLVTYRIDVKNSGDAAAEHVLVLETIPPGTSYDQSSLSIEGVVATDASGDDAASFDSSARLATYDLGTLAAGAERYVSVRVRVLPGATMLINRFRIQADGLDTVSFEQTTEVVRAPETAPSPPASLPVRTNPSSGASSPSRPPVSTGSTGQQVSPPQTGSSDSGAAASETGSSTQTGTGSTIVMPPVRENGVENAPTQNEELGGETTEALKPIEWIARPSDKIQATPILDRLAAISRNVPLVGSVVNSAREAVKAVRANAPAQTANSAVVAPATTAAVATATTSAVGFAGYARYAMFLLTQPLSLLDRRKRKGYGVIYNVGTKLPVDLAIVRLLDASGQRVVATRVTDRLGRYVFLPPPGTYVLEVRKPGLVFPPMRTLTGVADGPFSDLHLGGAITTAEGVVAKNVPLEPVGDLRATPIVIAEASRLRLQWAVASIGPGLAVASYAVTPKWEQVAAMILQFAFLFLFMRLAAPKRPKSWGTVAGSSGEPLRRAVVRIVESAYNKVLEAQVTDARGRYAFLAGQNRYFLTAEHEGYAQARTETIDFTQKKEPAFVAQDIELKPAP